MRLAVGRPRSRIKERLWKERGWRRIRWKIGWPRDNLKASWKPIIIWSGDLLAARRWRMEVIAAYV